MLPYAKTGCLGGPESCATTSGVKSSRIRCKEAAALMPRKNLLSLFADFARFGGDVAVIHRRRYRREKFTFAELYSSALFWRHALIGRGVVPYDRVLLWCLNSTELVACFCGGLLPGEPRGAGEWHRCVSQIRALVSPIALSDVRSAEQRLWAIHGTVRPAAARSRGRFRTVQQSRRNHSHHQARTRHRAHLCSAHA